MVGLPKASSKVQQRKFFALARAGKISKASARRHARSGKAFKSLPTRKGRKR